VLNQTPRNEDVCVGGEGVQINAFLTSALDGSEWSASRPSHFNPVEVRLGWLRAGLGAVVKRKKSLPLPGIEPR
jgi:hypothetical protein